MGSVVSWLRPEQFADTPLLADAVPDGQTPHTVSLCLYDELVDLVKPGDRINLTGIFRSVPVRLNPKQRVIKSLFKTYLDVVHIKKTDKKRMGVDGSTRSSDDRRGVIGVGGEDEEGENGPEGEMDLDGQGEEIREASAQAKLKERMVEISRREDIYEYLSRSLAPSIWEMDDVKKGILLQLFGGTNKSIAKGGGGGGPRYRGDINVLLVGDPGTSKSQILQVSLDRFRFLFGRDLTPPPSHSSTCTRSPLVESTPLERDLRPSD